MIKFDNKKIIVILLLLAILFSVTSLIITLNLNNTESKEPAMNENPIGTNNANVNFVLENPPGKKVET